MSKKFIRELHSVTNYVKERIYGCLGAPSSIFYNIHVAPAITRQGRSCISTSIMFFEAFLANNIKFGSLNEIVSFVDNIITEEPMWHFDVTIVDRPITPEELFQKLIMTCGYDWLPSMEDCEVIWRLCNRLSPELRTRVYYKNNVFAFFDCSYMRGLLITILQKLNSPFLDPNHTPKEIEMELNHMLELLREFVYYQYQYIDKIERVERMIREVSILTDTDSSMITLDPWYHYVLGVVKGIPMKIKNIELDAGDVMEADDMNNVEGEYREVYDFYNDEIIQKKRLINPIKIIPQDGLRYSIINVMTYAVSHLANDYVKRLCIISNAYDDSSNKPCLMSMKNEFLFKKILLTQVKKNYIVNQEEQEGHIVPKNKALDIKGLPIAKVGVPKSTEKALSRILFEDILDSEYVDQMKILNDLAVLERKIYDTIQNGSTDYFKPVRLKAMQAYKMPMRQFGIKASYIYNKIRSDDEPSINLEEPNALILIRLKINEQILNESSLRAKDPERYERILELLHDEEYIKGNIEYICIPYDIKVPEWIYEFIDYDTIMVDNIGAFPFESVGLNTLRTNSSYSAILNL